MTDFRPQWQQGQATVRELEAQLPSLRCVFAGWEAAENARLALADYLFAGDGHQAGEWQAHVHGSVLTAEMPDGARMQQYTPPDPARVSAFIAHWKRLVGFGDFHLRVRDAVTDRELGYV